LKKINENNIRVNDIEKMLVRNNLEIREYNFRANIIISVNENNLWVREINCGLVIKIMSK
jgi:hypothetical protein